MKFAGQHQVDEMAETTRSFSFIPYLLGMARRVLLTSPAAGK